MNSGLLLVLIMHPHARPAILRKINCSNPFEKKKERREIQSTVFSMLKSIFEFCVLLNKIRILIQIPISQSNAPQLSLCNAPINVKPQGGGGGLPTGN